MAVEIQLKSVDKYGEKQGTENILVHHITRFRNWKIRDKEGNKLKKKFISVWLADGSRVITPLSEEEFRKLKDKDNGK